MSLTPDQIRQLFVPLRRADSLPQPRSLSILLNRQLATGNPVRLTEAEARLFMTAAVDIWQRSVHSFVLSVALTRVSPIWSSVCGYYASHYAIRALAHLHGYFATYQRHAFLEATLAGNRFACNPVAHLPGREKGEHQFYWAMVTRMPAFIQNGIYWVNEVGMEVSDATHRVHANYADHLNRVTRIENVTTNELRDRIATAAASALEGSPSRPDRTKFPDLPNVISLAYLRIYRFREYVDDVLPPGNPFWRASRELGAFKNIMQFPPRPAGGIQAN